MRTDKENSEETPVTIYFFPVKPSSGANHFRFAASKEELKDSFFCQQLEELRRQYGYVWSLEPPQGWVEN
ncbi:MAG: hypothetical protein WCV72_01845 [Patescibacteria group bacterium]